MKALTPEQLSAVRGLVQTMGRSWKTRLRNVWSSPHLYVSDDTSTALYSLRNTHGPSWLRGARAVDFAAPGAA